MKDEPLKIGTRVKWVGVVNPPDVVYIGTITRIEEPYHMHRYHVVWDEGGIASLSRENFILFHEPNDLLKEIL